MLDLMLGKPIFNGQETVILLFTSDLFAKYISSIVHKEAHRNTRISAAALSKFLMPQCGAYFREAFI